MHLFLQGHGHLLCFLEGGRPGHLQPKRTIPSEFRPKIEELLAQMQDEENRATATARYSFAASCTRFWWYWDAARRPGGKDTLEEEEAMVRAARYINQHYRKG